MRIGEWRSAISAVFEQLAQRGVALLIASGLTGLALNDAAAQPVGNSLIRTSDIDNRGFGDVTESSGVADAIARHYERHPKWWFSCLNLVDLDGDGQLDLFLA